MGEGGQVWPTMDTKNKAGVSEGTLRKNKGKKVGHTSKQTKNIAFVFLPVSSFRYHRQEPPPGNLGRCIFIRPIPCTEADSGRADL